ncbi:MAG TPA: MFS transporter [Thermoleophilaceae bacterium]|nr:MFS transporter [Thermoleophilaceae bacterium]
MSAGVGSVAVGYGLARYGYGLFLPDLRAEFGLSRAALGLIASTAYASYLLAVISAGALTARFGPRLVVVAGGALAAAGMVVIAVAPSGLVLASGVFIAGASGGLVFPPFGDVVIDLLPLRSQSRALATISSGTGWGVLLAAPVALLAGDAWRMAWLAFTAVAILATLWAGRAVPDLLDDATKRDTQERLQVSWFLCPRSGPLLAGALLVGLAASVYWTFAVDLAAQADLGRDGARLLLGVVGAASIVGSLGGDLLERLGGRSALAIGALAMAAALALLASSGIGWVGAVVSAAAFGAAYNLIVALQTIWSARVFADRPAVGLGAVMFVLSVGLLAGPPLAGALADQASLSAAFFAAAALCAATTIFMPREDIRAAAAARR